MDPTAGTRQPNLAVLRLATALVAGAAATAVAVLAIRAPGRTEPDAGPSASVLAGPADVAAEAPAVRSVVASDAADPLAPAAPTVADSRHLQVWCGSFRAVPDLRPAVGYQIQWGPLVAPGQLPEAVFLKSIAPDVEMTGEDGAYTIRGATGAESWSEASIVCLDAGNSPVAVVPAVLDRKVFGTS